MGFVKFTLQNFPQIVFSKHQVYLPKGNHKKVYRKYIEVNRETSFIEDEIH